MNPISHIRCFLFDMDGTVFLGSHLLPGAANIFHYLNSKSIPYYFLTNNSSRSKYDYYTKLLQFGLPVSPDHILTSGVAAAQYLMRHFNNKPVYLLGTPSLKEEFRSHGIVLVGDTASINMAADVAVLGYDTTITYQKIAAFSSLIFAGLPYIATHADINCPTESGYVPDAGSFIALFTASTGRQPDVIIGKPHPPIVETVVAYTGFPVEQIAMVGDRLYTDIAMGQAGVYTILVLTGETRPGDLYTSPFQPNLIVNNIGELYQMLSSTR